MTTQTDELSLEGMLRDARTRKSLPPPATRRRIRQNAGLSQGDVARLLGVDRTSISQWESGRCNPTRSARGLYVRLLERLEREATFE